MAAANPILQFRQSVDPRWLEQVATHREDLPELDGYGADVPQERDDGFRPRAVEGLFTTESQTEPGGQPLEAMAPERDQDLLKVLPFLQGGCIKPVARGQINHYRGTSTIACGLGER